MVRSTESRARNPAKETPMDSARSAGAGIVSVIGKPDPVRPLARSKERCCVDYHVAKHETVTNASGGLLLDRSSGSSAFARLRYHNQSPDPAYDTAPVKHVSGRSAWPAGHLQTGRTCAARIELQQDLHDLVACQIVNSQANERAILRWTLVPKKERRQRPRGARGYSRLCAGHGLRPSPT